MMPFRTFFKDRKANAATEFAFILPIMLLLMAGIVEFGRLFQAYDAVNRLATRYASTYADCSDCSNNSPTGDLYLYYWQPAAVQNIAPQLNNTSSIVIRMFEIQVPSNGAQSPTVLNSYPSGLTWLQLSSAESSAATATISAGNKGVVVTVKYTHQLLFFSSLLQQQPHPIIPNSLLSLTYTVAQRKT